MISEEEAADLLICFEGFLYGLYSGIFAIYLQCPSKDSRTATIVFYVLCLLYVLSTAAVVCDLLAIILEAHISTLSIQLQNDSVSMLARITYVQMTVNGCCDFIAQCIIIYRCWIVWGKNIRVVIIPSFLAIAYMATWLAQEGASPFTYPPWSDIMILTGLAASMAVNALVTGLIVFKILKVFLGVKATSVERTSDSLSSTGGTKLQHIIFIIIESGMALFVIQLIRIVFTSQPTAVQTDFSFIFAFDFVIALHEMLNGIAPTIIMVRVSMRLSFDDDESFKEAVGSLHFNNPSTNPDTLALERVGSCINMPPEERNEVI